MKNTLPGNEAALTPPDASIDIVRGGCAPGDFIDHLLAIPRSAALADDARPSIALRDIDLG